MRIWLALRDRRLGGFKFVRQETIGPYIADFACRDRKLIVELDGGQHSENNRDRVRDAFLIRGRLHGAEILEPRRDDESGRGA